MAWRTEVARQQLLAAALQQFAAAQQAAAAASSTPAAGDASTPASQPASPIGSESTASTPVAALAARMAAASLECGGGGAAAPSVALRPQLPLAATCLRPFAFMPYKASGRTWVDDWNLQRQHLPMIAAAGSWVERRKVALPDFDFFSHMYRWVQHTRACGCSMTCRLLGCGLLVRCLCANVLLRMQHGWCATASDL